MNTINNLRELQQKAQDDASEAKSAMDAAFSIVAELEQSAPLAPHVHPAWGPGDTAHQGDLIFVALPKLPGSIQPRKERQLAEGDTKGSRHVLRGGKIFDASKKELRQMIREIADMDVEEKYIGPVFAGACTVEHPQHAHQEFPAHKATVVVFQRNLDAEEREQRVRD